MMRAGGDVRAHVQFDAAVILGRFGWRILVSLVETRAFPQFQRG
jgi:hypothetical protein